MPSSHRNRSIIVGLAAVALLGVGGVAGVRAIIEHHDRTAAPVASHVAVTTTHVLRTTLSNSVTATGAIRFAAPRVYRGVGAGVITALPRVGVTTERGQSLYRVNDQPVSVFYGSTPMFRAIDRIGLTGADIAVLASNLHALGFFDGYIPDDRHDTRFSSLLQSDLKHWQASIGATVTGSLQPGQVAVLPGTLRVTAVTATLGDPVAEPIAVLSKASQVVTGMAPAGLMDGPATLTLPDGSTVPARVSKTAGGSPTFIATPQDQSKVASVEQGNSVEVDEVTQIRRHVLAVPIVALLALQGGTRFALERPDGQLIAVRTGMFTSEDVEVSGTGLAAGTTVVTAS